jgi:DNA-binding Lrp family transcriptional regulator
MPAPLDATDLAILDAVTADGRASVNAIASRVGVARATAYARLARLEGIGVITGYTAVVDRSLLGESLSAVVLLNGGQNAWAALREVLASLPQVEAAYYVTGPADVVLVVRVANVVELRSLLLDRFQSLPGIRGTQTLLIIDEVVGARVS